jgi:hypothetical protein
MSIQQVFCCPRCQALYVDPQDWDQKHDCCKACAPRNKYRNRQTKVDGIPFDSLKEANHYQELLRRLHAGEIRDLVLQKKFEIIVNGEHVADYYADFHYVECASGNICTVDVKSAITRRDKVYRLKWKLVKALYGITIIEM